MESQELGKVLDIPADIAGYLIPHLGTMDIIKLTQCCKSLIVLGNIIIDRIDWNHIEESILASLDPTLFLWAVHRSNAIPCLIRLIRLYTKKLVQVGIRIPEPIEANIPLMCYEYLETGNHHLELLEFGLWLLQHRCTITEDKRCNRFALKTGICSWHTALDRIKSLGDKDNFKVCLNSLPNAYYSNRYTYKHSIPLFNGYCYLCLSGFNAY